MIKTSGELLERLSKVKKVNLCSWNTSLEDARKFCIEIMEIVNDCQVAPKAGTKIFTEYFEDCFTKLADVPFNFKQFQNESIGRISEMGTLDYPVSIIANLSNGSVFCYDLVTDHLSGLNKKWLDNQYELLNEMQADALYAKEVEAEAKRLEEQNAKTEQERADKLARERELGPDIYTQDKLQRKLDEIKKVDLCNEQTTEEEAMVFCLSLMDVVHHTKLEPKEATKIYKDFIDDCYSGKQNVPAKFLQNNDAKFSALAKMPTLDYPLEIINSLSKGNDFDCADAIEDCSRLTKKWLKANGAVLEDAPVQLAENMIIM